MRLPDHGRFTYSAITERPDFCWPDGRRLAVYVALNLEHFAFGDGLGGELAPGGPAPDVLNYAWREYGNRVGVWRMLEVFDALSIPVSLLVNSEIYSHCPQVVAAFRARGDEVVGHGRSNAERQGTLAEGDERTLIEEASRVIATHEGKPPDGWLGPWISESHSTPDLLHEQGFGYVLDWCHDDQPTWLRTRTGRILSVPYPQELNDIPAIMVRRASAHEFADMIIDQFEEMRSQAESQPLVMGIALHAYLVGQPFRLRALRRALEVLAERRDEIWLTTSGAIARHYARLGLGA
ncbi:MAG: polysaccharide deacetylase family protein [Pseudomonadota bacterium]